MVLAIVMLDYMAHSFRNFKKQNMFTKQIYLYDDISFSEILIHNANSVTFMLIKFHAKLTFSLIFRPP